ncbi:MAG: Hpt domain-containing protein [Thermodesulfobacteriota bacterium]
MTSKETGKMDKAGTGAVDRAVLDGIRMLEGPESRGLLVKVLNLYLSDSLKHVERIRSAVKSGDPGSLRSAAHSLKSGSANVGASGLAEVCRMVEEVANTGETPPPDDPLPARLEREYLAVRRELEELLAAERGESRGGE